MSETKRCTGPERIALRNIARKLNQDVLTEPALGDLQTRLGILTRRFGLPDRIVLTKAEKAEYAEFLLREGIENVA